MPITTTPETFRLPKPGQQDQHFGFTRSFYYNAEERGLIDLIRIKQLGRKRGVTLIPYDQVLTLVNKAKTK